MARLYYHDDSPTSQDSDSESDYWQKRKRKRSSSNSKSNERERKQNQKNLKRRRTSRSYSRLYSRSRSRSPPRKPHNYFQNGDQKSINQSINRQNEYHRSRGRNIDMNNKYRNSYSQNRSRSLSRSLSRSRSPRNSLSPRRPGRYNRNYNREIQFDQQQRINYGSQKQEITQAEQARNAPIIPFNFTSLSPINNETVSQTPNQQQIMIQPNINQQYYPVSYSQSMLIPSQYLVQQVHSIPYPQQYTSKLMNDADNHGYLTNYRIIPQFSNETRYYNQQIPNQSKQIINQKTSETEQQRIVNEKQKTSQQQLKKKDDQINEQKPNNKPAFRDLQKLMSYEEELEEGFICNINYELMNDPVLAEDGKYYEREAIVEWMKKKKESPITREPLTGKLFPDPELKLRIECYRELHPER